jgi:hypothetical protein
MAPPFLWDLGFQTLLFVPASLGIPRRGPVQVPGIATDIALVANAFMERLAHWIRGHDSWSFESGR